MFAVILGKSSPDGVNNYNNYSGIKLDENCGGEYEDECIYRQLVYRASFTLFLLFAIMALISTLNEYANRSFWVLKLAFAFLIFFALWWGDNTFFSGWAQFARFFSFGFLLVQALLLLDFAYDCHDVIMFNADEAGKTDGGGKYWLGFYLLLCLSFLTLSLVGVSYLYSDYSDCDAGAAFTSITLIFGVLTTVISILNRVNKGLLTPSIMFAYSAFMCWYGMTTYLPESNVHVCGYDMSLVCVYPTHTPRPHPSPTPLTVHLPLLVIAGTPSCPAQMRSAIQMP